MKSCLILVTLAAAASAGHFTITRPGHPVVSGRYHYQGAHEYTPQPYQAQQHVAQPYQAQHHVAQPYQAQHHVAQPYVAKPHVARPYVAQPYVARPYVAQHHAARPYHAQPYAPVAHASYANPLDVDSPSAKAALVFLNTLPLDTCGRISKAFIENILAGGDRDTASAVATNIYIEAYNKGERPAYGSPCEAAEVAFKQAVHYGKDPVPAAALAFMKAYQSDSPCSVTAFDYVDAISNGKNHIEAAFIAAKSFAKQIQVLAAAGKPTADPVCAQAALAYATSSDIPSTPYAEAMKAFITKALEVGNGNDPVCWAATEEVFKSYQSEKAELEPSLAAAKAFIKVYVNSPTPVADSPCAAAAKAYSGAIKNAPSAPYQSAMLAFIDEAILSNDDGSSPACAAAALAYFDAYETGAKEADATAAAGSAFLEAVAKDPTYTPESSCGRATAAYMATFTYA